MWTLRVLTTFKGPVPEQEKSEARPVPGRAERAGRACKRERLISGAAQASFGTAFPVSGKMTPPETQKITPPGR